MIYVVVILAAIVAKKNGQLTLAIKSVENSVCYSGLNAN